MRRVQFHRIAHYPALKARGALAHYEPVNAAALAPPFHGLGLDGYYYPAIASLQGIVYRNDIVTGTDTPRRLTDRWTQSGGGKSPPVTRHSAAISGNSS